MTKQQAKNMLGANYKESVAWQLGYDEGFKAGKQEGETLGGQGLT